MNAFNMSVCSNAPHMCDVSEPLSAAHKDMLMV